MEFLEYFASDEEDSETSDYMSEEEDDDHETEENDDDYETEENDFWTDEDDDEENHPPGEEEDHPPEEEEDHPPEEEEGNQNEGYSDATSMSVENNQISSVAVLKQFWSTLTKEIRRIGKYFKYVYGNFTKKKPKSQLLAKDTTKRPEPYIKLWRTKMGNEVAMTMINDENIDFDMHLWPREEVNTVTNGVTDLTTATPQKQLLNNTTNVPTSSSTTVTGSEPKFIQVQFNFQKMGTTTNRMRHTVQFNMASRELQLIIQFNDQMLKLRIQVENYSLKPNDEEFQAEPKLIRVLFDSKEPRSVQTFQQTDNPSATQEQYHKMYLNLNINYFE